MSFIKDIAIKNSYHLLGLLKFSWILFGAALICNLMSQVTSYNANKYDMNISRNLIGKEKGKDPALNELKLDKMHKSLNFWTITLNSSSLISLILGVIFLIIFTYNNF